MKVYVIYRFDDHERVSQKVKEICNSVKGIQFFMFDPNNKSKFWHSYAKDKIKNSNIVAFFDCCDVGEHKLKHIKWELDCAEKYRKRIIVFKDMDKQFAQQIYGNDYSEMQINQYRYKIKDIKDAVAFFQAEAGWRVDENLMQEDTCSKGFSPEYNQLLLEQYRIMVNTSENLMERRQSTGNLYTTICSTLIAFVGATFGFENLLISAFSSLLAGVIITILCFNWKASLASYELNNEGKFAVINEIEKHLPADMFECEYRYNTLNGIRSYSTREKRLPLIFTFFGIAMIILAVFIFVVQYNLIG